MSVSTTLAEIRFDVSANISQLSNEVGLRWYNDGRDILIDRIIQEKEDFFYDILTTDLTLGKNEYRMNKRGDLAQDGVTVLNGVAKTKSLSVKFKSTDEYYTKLSPKVQENLDYDEERYSETKVPFFILSDTSWFVYPTPTEDITDGLKAYVITYPKKLALTDEETLPDNFSKAIRYYVFARYYESSHRTNEAELMDAKFTKEINRVGNSLSGRISAPKQRTTPSFRNFK